MSITDTDKVDFISIHNETGEVVFRISDHLDWEDEYEHLMALQDKINVYLEYILDGQYEEEYPQYKGKKRRILIYSKYKLPDIAWEFIYKIDPVLTECNVLIGQRYLESGGL